MSNAKCLTLPEIEEQLCDLASQQLGIPRGKINPTDRLIEDLRCDSLELTELIMKAEEAFGVRIPNDSPIPVFKAVFTRQPFRLSDLAEIISLQRGTGSPVRDARHRRKPQPQAVPSIPFTQLSGRWEPSRLQGQPLFEPLHSKGEAPQYRRRSDGMRCVLVPSATVEIGCDAPPDLGDESPRHTAHLDAFLIDAEPVSTMAYCRFLNSIGTVAASVLSDWFVLDASDQRREHMLIGETVAGWQPTQGAEEWPVILVSWYGANAYSLWANGRDCLNYTDEGIAQSGSSLPSEAQWEYAARGARFQTYPWGDEAPTENRMTYGQHCQGQTYAVDPLPMAKVHESLGMSPFGLHHMAGNVWQWCRDWYDERFYSKSEASLPNPLNNRPTQVRAERGGSWVGPAELCRSSFRRGRPPLARGRCLGFRCISLLEDLDGSGR